MKRTSIPLRFISVAAFAAWKVQDGRNEQRTSIPLRFISVAAFAAWKVQDGRNVKRTSIPLRSISVAAFAAWKIRRKVPGKCEHFPGTFLLIFRASHCYT